MYIAAYIALHMPYEIRYGRSVEELVGHTPSGLVN
jgi:hypothetical protein